MRKCFLGIVSYGLIWGVRHQQYIRYFFRYEYFRFGKGTC